MNIEKNDCSNCVYCLNTIFSSTALSIIKMVLFCEKHRTEVQHNYSCRDFEEKISEND